MTPNTAFHSAGIPDEPGLAETYYSQFDDEFEREGAGDGDDDDDAEGTLLATVKLAGDDEVGDLINCMQNALDTSETSKLLTSSFYHRQRGSMPQTWLNFTFDLVTELILIFMGYSVCVLLKYKKNPHTILNIDFVFLCMKTISFC